MKICFCLLLVALSACSIGNNQTEDALAHKPAQTGYYAFKAAKTIVFPDPLPNMSPVRVEWRDSGEAKLSDKILFGWDFDKDGIFEMLEVRNKSGKQPAYYFDFDGDGKIDLSR